MKRLTLAFLGMATGRTVAKRQIIEEKAPTKLEQNNSKYFWIIGYVLFCFSFVSASTILRRV